MFTQGNHSNASYNAKNKKINDFVHTKHYFHIVSLETANSRSVNKFENISFL